MINFCAIDLAQFPKLCTSQKTTKTTTVSFDPSGRMLLFHCPEFLSPKQHNWCLKFTSVA